MGQVIIDHLWPGMASLWANISFKRLNENKQLKFIPYGYFIIRSRLCTMYKNDFSAPLRAAMNMEGVFDRDVYVEGRDIWVQMNANIAQDGVRFLDIAGTFLDKRMRNPQRPPLPSSFNTEIVDSILAQENFDTVFSKLPGDLTRAADIVKLVDCAAHGHSTEETLMVYAAVISFINVVNQVNVNRNTGAAPVHRMPNASFMRVLLSFLGDKPAFVATMEIRSAVEPSGICTVQVTHLAHLTEKQQSFVAYMNGLDALMLANYEVL